MKIRKVSRSKVKDALFKKVNKNLSETVKLFNTFGCYANDTIKITYIFHTTKDGKIV